MMEVLMWYGAYIVGMTVFAALLGYVIGPHPDDEDVALLLFGTAIWPLALPVLIGLAVVATIGKRVKASKGQ